MKLTIEPTSKIKAKLGIEPNGHIQHFFQNECYRYMDKYVPLDEGNLRKNVSMSIDGTYITYESPYAHYQYEGRKYVMDNGKSAYYSPTYGFWSAKGKRKHDSGEPLHYHLSGTGDHWDKRMWSAEGNDLVRAVQKEVDRGGK